MQSGFAARYRSCPSWEMDVRPARARGRERHGKWRSRPTRVAEWAWTVALPRRPFGGFSVFPQCDQHGRLAGLRLVLRASCRGPSRSRRHDGTRSDKNIENPIAAQGTVLPHSMLRDRFGPPIGLLSATRAHPQLPDAVGKCPCLLVRLRRTNRVSPTPFLPMYIGGLNARHPDRCAAL